VTTQTSGLAGTCLPSCSPSTTVTTGASIAVDGGADGPLSGGGSAEEEGSGTTESGTDATLVDATSVTDGSVGDAARDSGLAFSLCPGSSTCTSGTVAGPDCLP
jgi:hypothetical protein